MPGLISETQSSEPWFAAFTHAALSTAPKENLFAASSAFLGGFGILPVASTPQIRMETPPCGAALLHLSWQGHQTCTPQDINMQAQLRG